MAGGNLTAQGRRDAGAEHADKGHASGAALLRPSVTALNLPRLAGWYLIRFYQRFIGPAFPPACRFYPSCSTYALEAVAKYGLLKGSYLAARRLLRCHPFHPGGVDPVP